MGSTMGHEWRAGAFPRVLVLAVALVLALLGSGASALAQTWDVDPGSSVLVPTSADATCTCPDPPGVCNSASPGLAIPGFNGNDMGWYSHSNCVIGLTSRCNCRSQGEGRVLLDGIGTGVMTIQWDARASASHDCAASSSHTTCNCPSVYNTGSSSVITMSLDLLVTGLPAGTPVTVFYSASQFSTNAYRPEAGNDDTSSISGGVTTVGGANLYDGDLDLVNVRGNLIYDDSGSFDSSAGAIVDVDSSVSLDIRIVPPPRGHASPCLEYDSESVAWGGVIVLSLIGPPPPPVPVLPLAPPVEFSVDIGSSSELSDMGADLNDRFDPGDLYHAHGLPLPLGGADGVRDDAVFFGIDPSPDAPDGPPAATAAPVCSGMLPAVVAPAFFDLDGSDGLDFSLTGLIPPGIPLPAPIPAFNSGCVHRAGFLLLSFDDDRAGHYATLFCQEPTGSTSPEDDIHGSGPVEDEVVGALVLSAPGGATVATYPIASERDVHISLGPNPPPISLSPLTPDDDDVDALDVGAGCPVWLFSVDHEATMGILLAGADPGAIYESTGAGPVKVVDDVIHLGIPEDTDLDAFEFVFLPDSSGLGGEVLAVIYSVSDDDPDTLEDESGGLDPAMIYASEMTGISYPLLAEPLEDDIDAIAAWSRPLLALPGVERIRPRGGVPGGIVEIPE